VLRAHPGQIRDVKPSTRAPAVADVVANWKNTPGTIGARTILTKEA